MWKLTKTTLTVPTQSWHALFSLRFYYFVFFLCFVLVFILDFILADVNVIREHFIYLFYMDLYMVWNLRILKIYVYGHNTLRLPYLYSCIHCTNMYSCLTRHPRFVNVIISVVCFFFLRVGWKQHCPIEDNIVYSHYICTLSLNSGTDVCNEIFFYE